LAKINHLTAQLNECLDRFLLGISESNLNVTACYLTGSGAGNYFIEGASDLDISVFIQNDRTTQQSADNIISELIIQASKVFKVQLDISIIYLDKEAIILGEGAHIREGIITSKYGGICLLGRDILKDYPTPFEMYLKHTIKKPIEFFSQVRHGDVILYPLNYPAKEDFYYGYLFPSQEGDISTKLLISIYTWIAAALISYRNKVFVIGKKPCIDLLKKIEPEMGDFLEIVYEHCRNKWKYKIPVDNKDIVLLRSFCCEVKNWENFYLREYDSYV